MWIPKVNSHVPPSGHLFSFEMASRALEPMCKTWFLDRCNEVCSFHHLSILSGHSFRIGGTMHLLLCGVDPFIVMAQGASILQLSWNIGVFVKKLFLHFLVFHCLHSHLCCQLCLCSSSGFLIQFDSYGESV